MLDKFINTIDVLHDKIFSKVSKKLSAFLVSTILLWFGKIDGDVWEIIAITYIGSQAAQDMAVQWKHGPSNAVTSKNETIIKEKVVPEPPNDERGP